MGSTIRLDQTRQASSPAAAAVPRFVWPVRSADPLKVALLWPWLGMGGAERWLIAMASSLLHVSRDLGGRPLTVSGAAIQYPLDQAIYQELSHHAPVLLNPDPWRPTAAVDQLVAESDAIIIGGFGDIRQLARMARGPVIFIAHGACRLTTELAEAAFTSRVATHYTAVSEISKSIFPPQMQQLVTVIENGGEVERTTPLRGRDATRAAWGVAPNQRVIGYMGRLGPDKRSEALGEAIACLPAEYMGVLVGNGDQEPQALAHCQSLAPGRIRFGGQCRQVGDALAGMDAWLGASPSEGFCLSRIEASLAGVPVISTPTGDLTRLESIHGQLTWPIPIGATGPQIASQIATCFARPHDTAEIVERSRKLSQSRYTTSAMATRWCDFLWSVLPKPT